MSQEQNLLQEFVIEAKEHLSTVEEDLLELERQQHSPDPQLVSGIFRAVHTVKGAAGFFALARISSLAHQMETVLSLIRSGERRPDKKAVDTLLSGIDFLNTMLDDVEHSQQFDVSEVSARLASLLKENQTSQVMEDLTATVPLTSPQLDDVQVDISRFTLGHRQPEHCCLYRLRYDLDELFQKKISPLALIRELLETGEILDGRIVCSPAELRLDQPPGPAVYEIIYSTIMEPDLMAQVAGLPPEKVVSLAQVDGNNTQQSGAPPVSSCLPPASVTATKPETLTKSEAGIDGPAPPVMEPTREVSLPPTAEQAASPSSELETAIEENPGLSTSLSGGPSDESTADKSTRKPASGDTIRISLDILDKLMNLAGELVLVRNQQLMVFPRTDAVLKANVQRLDLVTSELQETIMRTRMQPLANIFGKFPRIVRDLGRQLGKQIELTISGQEVELDKSILEAIGDPLTHLIRNCCDHGLETPTERHQDGKPPVGQIRLRAFHEAGKIIIEIVDDGRGLPVEKIKKKALANRLRSAAEIAAMSDKEILSLIFLPGFSTAEKVTDVSGRGVGMDVVKTHIERLGGTVDLDSNPGRGTLVRLRLPLTLAIIPCLVILSEDQRYAVPQINLVELVRLYDDDLLTKIDVVGDQEVFRLRDRLLPLVRLNEVLARSEPFSDNVRAEITHRYLAERLIRKSTTQGHDLVSPGQESLTIAVVKAGAMRFGLIVDQVLGTEEIVVKPMHSALKELNCYAGATVMGDGRVALILNVDGMAAHAGLEAGRNQVEASTDRGHGVVAPTQSVLLFKSGPQERFGLALPLVRRVERIQTKAIETVGHQEFITFAGQPTRVLRLDAFLDVSSITVEPEMYMILPKKTQAPYGVLASSIVDITTCPLELNTDSLVDNGLLGTAVIRNRLTLFPDLAYLTARMNDRSVA